MAGDSGTPLARKLGIQPGYRVALLGAPEGYEGRLELGEDIEVRSDLRGRRAFDLIQFFTTGERELLRRFAPLSGRLSGAGGLWVSWPKKSSGVETDLGDGVVRRIGLDHGLVDNKVCAVDETWSALRFVVRLVDRG